jgi:hypothetical protein
VQRDGVAFRCEPHDESHEHDAAVLAPGESFAFARTMHCWTPAPGRYEVESFIALGDDPTFALAGTFAMDLLDDPASAPRACPERPGLYVAMGGDRRTQPIPMRRDGREDGYHVVIVIANASRAPVHGGSLKVAFMVRRKGSDVACGGETIARSLPETLASGEVHVFRVPVTCIREKEGAYVVTGQLAFDEPVGSDAIEIGRVSVRVTSDPLLLWPMLP